MEFSRQWVGCRFPVAEELRLQKKRDESCNRRMIKGSMKFSLILCHPGFRRGLAAAGAAVLTVCAAGCASPGQPRPPSLNLPEVVTDLSAARVGDVVEMRWTTPEKTTDRLDVKGPMTAEICRITVSSAGSSGCDPVLRLPVLPGVGHAEEALAPVLTVDPPALLGYRVEILNGRGRSAGLSPEVFVASGLAPPAVDQLRATATRDGAMLEWEKKDSAAVVELDRLPIGSNGVAIGPSPAKPASTPSSKSFIKKQGAGAQRGSASPKKLVETPPAATEARLRTPGQMADAGGTIDRTAEMGESYRYTAQRVRTVSLGGHMLELRSFASGGVTVAMRNSFPPHAPGGLEAVPGGAEAGDRSIDLSWTPNTESDLAGYIVYRQEIAEKGVAAGTATRLNPTPVAGPAYRDQTAVAGRRYAYFITAIDTAGNESAPSETVRETAREQ
jgi:hypothetical protein